jgi:RND family efflux transporter MFP subunit
MKLKNILFLSGGIVICAFLFYKIFFARETVAPVSVTRGRLVSLIYATGKVTADDIAILRCEAGGNITFLGAREGASIRKGALLLSTDKSEIVLRINQMENELTAAEVDVNNKRTDVDRTSNLLQAHSIPQKEYDAAKRDYDLAVIMLDRRRIMVDQEKKNLSKRSVLAPFDCLVYNVSVNQGDYLPPNTECFRVLSPKSMIVEAQVDEQDLAKVTVGQHALAAFDAYPGKKFDAVVARIVPQTDEATKTSKVFLRLSTSPVLNIGMTATVNIIAGAKDSVLILPKSAIVNRNNKQSVFRISDGKLVETEVALGIIEGAYVEVLSGVSEGMQIVREPKPAYKENMKVTM